MSNSQTASLQGFTLIELMVVMTIVAVLSAIAVPQYNTYKKKAFDARALADLRNVAAAEEAYFMDHEKYLSCQNQSCALLPGIARLSKGVNLSVEASEISFVAIASHPQGSGKAFEWDSDNGGLQE